MIMRRVMTTTCLCQDGRRPSGLTSAGVIGLLVGLATLALAISACGGGSTLPSVSVPQGWTSYTYGKAAISVPSSWEVKHKPNCPNTNAPGATPGIPEGGAGALPLVLRRELCGRNRHTRRFGLGICHPKAHDGQPRARPCRLRFALHHRVDCSVARGRDHRDRLGHESHPPYAPQQIDGQPPSLAQNQRVRRNVPAAGCDWAGDPQAMQ